MNSRILDQETLGAVVAAAPHIKGQPELLAREIIRFLSFGFPCSNSKKDADDIFEGYVTTYGIGEGQFFSISLQNLSDSLDQPNPRQIGAVLTDLGMTKIRHNDGYHLFWNEYQLLLLRQALGIQEASDD